MARAPLSSPFLPWTRLAVQAGEVWFASSLVIPVRLGRMAAAGHAPSARDRREFARMGPEKVQAGIESWFAVAAALQKMQWQFLASAWQPWTHFQAGSHGAHWPRLAHTALTPIHRAVTANARRLTRVKASSGKARR
jgi:hypothetical protein